MAKANIRFNPDRIAYFEVAGWRAYYDRQWFKVIRLMIALVQEQFGVPFPMSLVAAYYITRASIAWAPVEHDEAVVQQFIEKFYRVAARYADLKIDPAQLAPLEFRYWKEHRDFSGKTEKPQYMDTMTKLHSALFGISLEQARESGELRVQVTDIVDTITGHTSTDMESDWRRSEELLRQCYRSIDRVLKK
ncbi:MAG: hypothetical protein R3E39_24260 [Anaerolineae bacterium]